MLTIGLRVYSVYSLSVSPLPVYLTHLDYADTESLMTDKLYKQVNGTEYSWKNLNTVSIAMSNVS